MMKKPGQTRKKQRITPTTIPELKRSFDALEGQVASIIHSTASQAQRVKKFQVAWRKIFGRPVDSAAAEAYLQVKSRRAAKRTRKVAKQHGGAAPIDHQTGPGIYGPHGVFPPYVASGLSFYDTVNKSGQFSGCGIENTTPNVPADLGSNAFSKLSGGSRKSQQRGGSFLGDAFSAIMGRPIPASAPPTVFGDAQQAWLGRSLGPSPAPEDNPLKYV